MDDLLKSLDIDKSEWLEDINHGDSLSASFIACVGECISERESRKFEEGLILILILQWTYHDSVLYSDARLHVNPIHFLARRAVC